ncbi:Retrovirus-related Pol polyprotein from transposon RE2 [Vitis vinifera]|uniref:Retrovirus-related Pol polyprotein from transposon RE2 n=1 Tax=Vitis vinifera TaxID=29760 RepID=A0A438CW69_VITVI|nr:Retrovirus-related Pol polyprotein from transposon RE2 [Vitis vinifera]
MATKSSIFSSVISGCPMITSEKLVGSENYLSWSASVELWFIGQGYEDHLVMQEADIPEVDKVQWRKIDAQLCSVLWQSVDPKILLHRRAYKTCFKYWNQAKGLYTNDIQRLYKIDKFFMVLTLIGLRSDLETVRDQILGSSSVPSLDDVGNRGRGQRPHCTYCNKLATLVIGVISYIGGLPALPTWPSHLIHNRLSLRVPPHLRTGNASACFTHTSSLGPWILDSGASDHISGNKDLFSSITTTFALPTVTLANGSQTVAKGIGLTHPLPSLPLTSVLYTPECSFNLISISKITRTLNCSITFSDKFVTLQDRSTGKTIGIGLYMEQPPGFVAQGESGLVCRLRRSLYDLKQSPRAWFSRFSSVVKEFGMFRSTTDHSVFYHHNSSGQCIYLVVYVDDIVIKGKLNYLTITGPDISFPVSVVSQFLQLPCDSHWDAIIRILRYIKSTLGQGVLYDNRCHTQVVGYIDADWAGSPTDRRSTSGYCVFIGGNLISWKSKKQDVVAKFSAEVEYRVMALATCELIWLKHLLQELRFGKDEQMKLICDNQAALHIASNPVFHERTKHIEVDCHFIREKITSVCVATSFVNSNDQLVDIFTKSLRGPRIKYICNKLGAYDIYAPI